MQERDRVTVLRLERNRSAADGNGAGKGDDPGCWGEHGCARLSADVDPAVLACRVGVASEGERPEHGAVDRPRPGRRRRWNNQDEKRAERGEPDAHDHLRVVCVVNEPVTVPEESAVVNVDYRDAW